MDTNGWISIDKSLPQPYQEVLVYAEKYKEFFVVSYDGKTTWWSYEGGATAEHWGIKYWHPLTEPSTE